MSKTVDMYTVRYTFDAATSWQHIYTVSQKKAIDVAHYNFNAHQLILVIFGRDVAERICYHTVI